MRPYDGKPGHVAPWTTTFRDSLRTGRKGFPVEQTDWGQMALRTLWAIMFFVVVVALGMQLSGCYASTTRLETPAGTTIHASRRAPFYGRDDTVVDSRDDYRQCLTDRGRQGIWSDDQMICFDQTTPGGMGGYYGGYTPYYTPSGYSPYGYGPRVGAWKGSAR